MATQKNSGLSEDTKTLITIALLIFAYPIGLILMYVWMKWPRWLKFLILLPIVIMVAMFIVFGGLGIFIAANSPR